MSIDSNVVLTRIGEAEFFIRRDIANAENAILDRLDDNTNLIAQVIVNSENAIIDAVNVSAQGTRAVVNARTTDILNAISDSTQVIDTRISEISNRVEQAVIQGVASIGDQILPVIQDSLGELERSLQGVTDTIESVGLTITDKIVGTQHLIDKETEEIDLALNFSVIPRLMAVQRDLDTVLKEQLDIDVAIRESTAAIIEQMQKSVEESKPLSAFEAIVFLLKQVFGIASPGPDGASPSIEQSWSRFLSDTRNVAVIRDFFTASQGDSVFANLVLNIVGFIAPSLAITSAATSVAGERLRQEFHTREPHTILAPPDAVAALFRGAIDESTFANLMARHGYADSMITAIKTIARNLLSKEDILRLWLRDELTADAAAALLKEQGYTDLTIAQLQTLAHPIPPVQDLIVMAVREVFSPEIAASFGQFEDFPDAFKTFAAQQGLTEEWAQRYWAAHWDLPSATMGFEMLHRRIIDRDQLNMLLRSLDVMPFWRDKMVQLSFNPLTRVDVRRMHKLGVLDDQGVFDAYLDIGYSPENAQLLLDFTKQLNAGDEDAVDPELEKLTRSAITSLYEDGALNRQDALNLLISIGIGSFAADVFLTLVDVKEQAEERKAQKDLILAQFDAGQLTFEEAQARLGSVGLETQEQAKAVAALAKRQASRTKMPDRSDLDRFVKAGLITDAEYLDAMRRAGFSDTWTQRFLTLAKRGGSNDSE